MTVCIWGIIKRFVQLITGSYTETAVLEDMNKKLKKENEELRDRLLPPEPPGIIGNITGGDILQLLANIFPAQSSDIHISDVGYKITTIGELRRFINWDDVNIFPYTSQYHDCDDFALALAGDFAKYPEWSAFPVSFIWGDLYDGHAFGIAIAWPSLEDRTPTVYFVEPQNDHEIAMEMVEDMILWLLPI